MNKKLQPVRGTKDILPDDYRKHQHIIDVARDVARLYGFEGFSTPIFEFTDVFKRTLGDTSDVVNKEMYTFEDRGGESLTLRPEFTAGIARSFISNGLQQNLPLKLFSHGPLFRYERPQKGRQRQFNQVNFEWLGNASPLADVEMITMAAHILNELGLKDKITLKLNTLGCAETRENYTKALVEYLNDFRSDLSEDSIKRLDKNPLRILDSKNEGDKEIVADAPRIMDCLSDCATQHFNAVKRGIDTVGLIQNIDCDSKLVRGLDYYTHTVFEFVSGSSDLGAQNTILAGGRYDGLIEHMGGVDTPAIGFAAGIERLVLMVDKKLDNDILVVIISLDEPDIAMNTAFMIRENGIAVEILQEKNPKKGRKKADKMNASHVIVMDKLRNEIGELMDLFTIKNMNSGTQKAASIDNIIMDLKNEL